ncbi:MAG: S-layer homology domain-containing protein [Chloroflexota bacterium]
MRAVIVSRRAIISIAILVCALAGVGVASGAANYPATDAQDASGSVQAARYGIGGKISLPPPGNWQQSLGPVDTRSLGGLLGQLLPPTFGTDVQVSTGSANEVTIAANPTNPLNFLAGGNLNGRFTTTDGGVTWNRGTLPGGGDPAVVFDAAGNAYFAQLGNTATCPDANRVWRSTDGGMTFGAYVVALSDPSPGDHFIDKEWLAADRAASSPTLGRIYITATSFHTPPGCDLNNYIDNRIVLAYSSDQGATWSQPVTVSDASHNQNQFSKPVVANNGTLYISYQYQNCTFNCSSSIPMVNLITKSTDGGITFSPSMTITGQTITPTGAFVSGYQYLYAGSTSSGFRHNDQAVIDVSPTDPNVVYAVWTEGRWDTSFVYQNVTGQHGDIAFSRSTDGGATWTAAVRINDDTLGNGKDQFFPWMVVGSDGTIHASWSDRRDSGAGYQYRQYYTQSTDGGLTWAANQQVADVGGTPSTFIGDYSGIAVNSDNTLVLPIWTDMRSGQQAYTDRGILSPQITPTIAPPTATSVASTATATTAAPTATSGVATVTATSPAATATGVSTTTATPTACTLAFTDVPEGSTFYPFIRCLACRGIINGYPEDNTFRPNNPVSRGQLAKIVSNSAGFTDPAGAQIFEDVLPGSTFFDFVQRLASRGYMSGYPCGGVGEPCGSGNLPYFRPNANATRGQISKIVSNAAGFTEPAGAQAFEDVLPGSTFYDYIQRLASRNIMSGYPCGSPGEPCGSGNLPYFRPNLNATRGQTAKIVGNTFFPNCQTPAQR